MGMARCSFVLLCVLVLAMPPATAIAAGGCPEHKPNCCDPLSSSFDVSLYLTYCLNIDGLPVLR